MFNYCSLKLHEKLVLGLNLMQLTLMSKKLAFLYLQNVQLMCSIITHLRMLEINLYLKLLEKPPPKRILKHHNRQF